MATEASERTLSWARANPEKRRALNERSILRRVDYVEWHKSRCIDCGITDRRVLQFDHVRGEKVASPYALAKWCSSWQRVMDELDKCEVRCANCHMIRHMEEGLWE